MVCIGSFELLEFHPDPEDFTESMKNSIVRTQQDMGKQSGQNVVMLRPDDEPLTAMWNFVHPAVYGQVLKPTLYFPCGSQKLSWCQALLLNNAIGSVEKGFSEPFRLHCWIRESESIVQPRVWLSARVQPVLPTNPFLTWFNTGWLDCQRLSQPHHGETTCILFIAYRYYITLSRLPTH